MKTRKIERNWKNFKLDPNKVYTFIGKTVVFLCVNLMWTYLMVFGFLQMTVYR